MVEDAAAELRRETRKPSGTGRIVGGRRAVGVTEGEMDVDTVAHGLRRRLRRETRPEPRFGRGLANDRTRRDRAVGGDQRGSGPTGDLELVGPVFGEDHLGLDARFRQGSHQARGEGAGATQRVEREGVRRPPGMPDGLEFLLDARDHLEPGLFPKVRQRGFEERTGT